MAPIVIHRHWFIYFVTAFLGVGSVVLIWWFIIHYGIAREADPTSYYLLAYTSGVILLITIVELYVYSLSYIQLDDNGITAVNFATLFASNDEVTAWNRVQDVSVNKGGIFAQLLNYGTLTVQDAGTNQEITMTFVPNVESVQATIEQHAEDTPLKVQVVTP